MAEYDFRRVSPTAFKVVASLAMYTDVSSAKSMVEELRKDSAVRTLMDGLASVRPAPESAVYFEARYKAINWLLDQYLDKHSSLKVLELAAGFSPRGLELSSNPAVSYVETDLPEQIRLKETAVTSLLGKLPSALKYCAADATKPDEVVLAASTFSSGPVVIVTEGLLRYLTLDEKNQLLEGVRAVLETYGGCWITPDIHLEKWTCAHASFSRTVDLVGRDLLTNYFSSFADARSFFANAGFSIEEHPLLEHLEGKISSLHYASSEQRAQLAERAVWVMRLK